MQPENHLNTLGISRLQTGDRVRLVSPASYPDQAWLDESMAILEGWGLQPEVGQHAMKRRGYMAGSDADRLSDLEAAFRDPDVRAIVTTRGGAGCYRLTGMLDARLVRANPKPVIGFSDITYLHLDLWNRCRLPGIHGGLAGEASQSAIRRLLMTDQPLQLFADPLVFGASLRTKGQASGTLLGGNLTSMSHMVGAGLPSFEGAILLIEDTRQIGIGRIDRQLTQLKHSGALGGLKGIAIGRFLGFEDYADRSWTLLDVLSDHFGKLDIPIVGGFHLGHGENPMALPLGVGASIDATDGSLSFGVFAS